MFLLAACGNSGSGSDDKKSESKDTKDTVKIENNYKASGEKRDFSVLAF